MKASWAIKGDSKNCPRPRVETRRQTNLTRCAMRFAHPADSYCGAAANAQVCASRNRRVSMKKEEVWIEARTAFYNLCLARLTKRGNSPKEAGYATLVTIREWSRSWMPRIPAFACLLSLPANLKAELLLEQHRQIGEHQLWPADRALFLHCDTRAS